MRKILHFSFWAFTLCLITNVVSAQVTVTKRDTLIYDANGNLLANPGDSLRYKTKIKNTSGANVTGATLDMNASSNLGAPTTIRTTPVALNDTYGATGNIGITVPAGSGLKLNDFDDNLALATIQVQVNQPTAMGGTVNVNADGSFTYVPAAGFTGADNFTYVLEDGNEVAGCPPINHAVVTLNVAAAAPAMIWFIDNGAGGSGGTGTLNNPFRTLNDFNISAGPQIGHIVFIENTGTTYTGGIFLKDNQTLWGTGHTGGTTVADLITEASFSFTLPPINGTRPFVTNSTSAGIQLAANNIIRGLNAGTTQSGDFAIRDNASSIGNINITEVSILNATGAFRASAGGALNVAFTSITTSGGSVNTIFLVNTSGSFNGGTGSIANPTGACVLIQGGTVGLTYSGNMTQANNAALVNVTSGHNTGTVTFQTGTLSATNGPGLVFDNADSPTSYNFNGTTTLNGGTAGIKISGGSAGAFTFSANTSITSPADTAFTIIGGTASVTYSGNITQANNFPMVSVSGGHTTGTITFQTGTLSGTNGSGLQFDNADSPTSYNFNGPVTLNNSPGIDIVNTSIGSFTFANTTIINASGDAVEITGSNATVSFNGKIKDNADYAIDIDNHDANIVTFSGDSLVSTGSGVRVLNSNGGTVNFNHVVKMLTTGATMAVDLTTSNVSGTMNFGGGGLVISTTSGIGFNAIGGGTVTVQGSSNTISSTTGTALNVANTTIGAADLTFRSISSNGGSATGIILDNTGSSGGLQVTGTGSAGSGGTIAEKTGADGSTSTGIGIYLNNTADVQLNYMQLNDFDNYAIRGLGVSGFTLDNSVIKANTGTNGTNVGVDEGSVVFGVRAGTTGLTGTASVINTTIEDGAEDNLGIYNTSGILNVTIDNVSINQAGNGAIITEQHVGGTINIAVNNSDFTNNFGPHFFAGANGAANVHVTFGTTGANTMINTLGDAILGGTVGVQTGVAWSGTGSANLSNNTITGAQDTPLNVNIGGTGTFTAILNDNTIGTSGVAESGTDDNEDAIRIVANGDKCCDATPDGGTFTVAVTNNTIQQVAGHGIFVIGRDGGTPGDPIAINITITGNTLLESTTATANGIRLESGASSSAPADDVRLHADIGGAGALANTFVGDWGGATFDEIRLRHQFSAVCQFILTDLGANTSNTAIVVAYLTSRNNLGGGVVSATIAGGGVYETGGIPPQP